ncbi:MAG: DUF3048 domain-containing protein [Catenulispora sp.]|nr:DUF3048 domain-containing protein [Catenulispora sp.]
MRRATVRNATILACCAGALSLTAACGHHGTPKPAAQTAPSTPAPSPTPSPTPTPTPAPSSSAPSTSPLTGLPGPAGAVLAVKIDDIVYARPQTGLAAADVVYAIEVEGGLSRFLAVFDAGHLPPGGRIGPVRSARESDLPILEQYGKVDFAYSGALTKFLPVLAAADVFNASPDQDGGAYSRDKSRKAPYNQYLNPAKVLADFPGSAPAKDIGFRFGDAPPGGTPTASITARMPSASFTFTWNQAKGQYLVAIDGKAAATTDGGPLGAPTIVLQKVAETTSPRGFHDVPNQLSPFSPTVGSGQAVVLRDGNSYTGTWSRPDEHSPTSFTFDGQPMLFHPGQVWVVLTPK